MVAIHVVEPCRVVAAREKREQIAAGTWVPKALNHLATAHLPTKVCPKCKVTRHKVSEFDKSTQTWDGLHSVCRYCKREMTQERRKRNQEEDPLYYRKQRIRYKYGLSWDEYQEMWSNQEGLCAACEDPLVEDGGQRTCVDHCHATGRVRGLLCGSCNTALGQLEDDPERIRGLLRYLETSSVPS